MSIITRPVEVILWEDVFVLYWYYEAFLGEVSQCPVIYRCDLQHDQHVHSWYLYM